MRTWTRPLTVAAIMAAAGAPLQGEAAVPHPPASAALRLAQAPDAMARARAVVTQLQDGLLAVMKSADTMDFAGRVRALDPLVRRTHNLLAMAAIAVGPFWDKMSDVQQDAYVDAFSRLSVAHYANRFDGYSGETFEVVTVQPGPRDSIMVRSHLNVPNDKPVRLNYIVRDLGDGGWQIVDVFLEGSISELAVRRSEYTSVLRSEGVEALIRALERKITQLASDS